MNKMYKVETYRLALVYSLFNESNQWSVYKIVRDWDRSVLTIFRYRNAEHKATHVNSQPMN